MLLVLSTLGRLQMLSAVHIVREYLSLMRCSTCPQALPYVLTTQTADDTTSWQTTVHATQAICGILAAMMPADMPACEAVLQDGSWDAAVQRVRWASAKCALHLVSCHACTSGHVEMRVCMLLMQNHVQYAGICSRRLPRRQRGISSGRLCCRM